MNRIVIIGNCGKDPEIRKGKNDTDVARFPVATSFSYKDKEGEKVAKTTWHNCVAFGKTAGLIGKYVFKGSKVAVEGRVENTSTTNDAGEKKFYSDIVVETVEFLSSKKERSEEESEEAPTDKKFDASKEWDDEGDLPF